MKVTLRFFSMAAAVLMLCAGTNAATINEIRIDNPGSDTDEYFELAGTSGESLDGLFYIVIGDGAGGSGVVESITDLDGESIPTDGYFLVGESSMTLASPDLDATLGFENSDNVTHMLVSNFTGVLQDDLDTTDDGTLDITPWDAIIDSVALVESVGSGDLIYSTTTSGPDGTFVPGHSYRLPNGSGAFQIGGFGLGDNDTPGVANVPEPASIVIFSLLALGAVALRRRTR